MSRLRGVHAVSFFCLLALATSGIVSQTSVNVESANGNRPQAGPDGTAITMNPTRPGNNIHAMRLRAVLRLGRDVAFVIPAPRWTASLAVIEASVMAIYYNNERPYPTMCHLVEPDKWQHCYVGCMIAAWCPLGSLSASVLAVLKELWDVANDGRFSWADAFATLGGTWNCACWDSCEACCCKQRTEFEATTPNTPEKVPGENAAR